MINKDNIITHKLQLRPRMKYSEMIYRNEIKKKKEIIPEVQIEDIIPKVKLQTLTQSHGFFAEQRLKLNPEVIPTEEVI